MSRQPRLRYNIEVRGSKNGSPLKPFIWNRGEPLRPGSVDDAMHDAVVQQYEHMEYDGKFVVRGLDLWDKHGVIFMWVDDKPNQFKRVVVIRKVLAQ